MKRASIVDLIRIAYGYPPDRILGGPSWLEMNRFDVIAKVPADTTPETVKPMLQSLLSDRFHLVLHKENRPFPGYALVVNKKPQLKPADASGTSACRQQPPPAEPSAPTQFICRNVTMAAFADWLSAWLSRRTAIDRTNLQGAWDFDFGWTLRDRAHAGSRWPDHLVRCHREARAEAGRDAGSDARACRG